MLNNFFLLSLYVKMVCTRTHFYTPVHIYKTALSFSNIKNLYLNLINRIQKLLAKPKMRNYKTVILAFTSKHFLNNLHKWQNYITI